MTDNERVIRAFMGAWSRLDPDELASYFCEDGVYHNMPMKPVAGRENVRALIARFIEPWTRTDWEIVNLIASGDLVVAERIDHTTAGDRHVDLPCTGIFEMQDGRIRVWRDYFDYGTYARAIG